MNSLAAEAQLPASSRATIALLLWMSILSTAFLTLAPALVGAFTDHLGFSPEQAGLTVAAQLTGSGFGVLAALMIWRGIPPRSAVIAAICAMALGDVASAFVHTSSALIMLRAIAGFPAGLAFAAVNAAVAQRPHPERLFIAVTGVQMLFGVFGYIGLPHVLEAYGVVGAFVSLGLCSLLCVPLAPSFPSVRRSGLTPAASSLAMSRRGALVLGSLLANYVANSAVWTYLDRIGIDAGLSPETVTFALAASMFGGLGGSALAMVLSGRRRPVIFVVWGMLSLSVSTALLLVANVPYVYTATVVLFTAGMMFVVPFYLSLLAALPNGERLAVIATLVIVVGLALGPYVGSQIVSVAGYRPLILIAVVLFIGSAGLAAGALRARSET